jgi:hypothetical protein
MNSSLIDTLVPIAIVQTGALIYFAGVVSFTLRNHEDRHNKTEARCENCTRIVTQVATKEGIPL